MTDKFEVGEVAIYINKDSEKYGVEVTVLGLIDGPNVIEHFVTGEIFVDKNKRYWISNPYGETLGKRYLTKPEFLKKKKPPAREIDQIVCWDKCLWKPEGVKA